MAKVYKLTVYLNSEGLQEDRLHAITKEEGVIAVYANNDPKSGKQVIKVVSERKMKSLDAKLVSIFGRDHVNVASEDTIEDLSKYKLEKTGEPK